MSGAPTVTQELSLGEVLSRTLDYYRRNFARFIVTFIVIEAVIGGLTTLVRQSINIPALTTGGSGSAASEIPGILGPSLELLFLILAVTLVFYPIAISSAIKLASDEIEGRPPDMMSSVKFAASKLLRVWVLSILVGIVVLIGFVAIVIPGVILSLMFFLVLPVLLLENPGIINSLSRSRQLVGQRWLKTFALAIVVGIIIVIASVIAQAVSTPFGVASTLVSSILSAFYLPIIPIMLTVYYYSNVARLTPPQPAQSSVVIEPGRQLATKFCPSCGAPVAESSTFCPSCGAKLTLDGQP